MKNRLLLTSVSTIWIALNTISCFGQKVNNVAISEFGNKQASQGDVLLNFVLRDTLDRKVRMSDFKGKYILIDMFFTGCGACISVAQALREVHGALKNKEIVFVSLSTDKNKQLWLQSIRENAVKTTFNPWAGSYAAEKGTIMLYTGGSGNENDFCRKYVPDRFYPKLLLIDPKGKLVEDEVPRPDRDPMVLINYLNKLLE